jgi:uncharacterized protein YeaO (DUF488 family)
VRQLKFLSTLGIACVFLFSSCGGDGTKTTDTAVTDSTATTAADSTAPPATTESTINTTPENIMIVRHKVSNFAKWKISYDAHDSMRLANGIHNFVIGRGVSDSNMVMVAVKADDLAKAKAFAKDPSLKAAMHKGGVIGAPSISFNTIVYQDMAKNMPDLRSMTTFTVKDWDAFKTHFESNRQVRKDNGLTDRAYGYDADDNHKVTLVTAVNDTAKANAYWKSDLLKQKRAEAGVVGEAKRFVYRVVQTY